MGYSSQSGSFIVASQPTKGVFAPTLETTGLGLKIRSGGLSGSRDLLQPDAEIGAGRDISDAYAGTVGFGGDLEMYARMRAIAFFLKHALGGSVTSVAAAGAPAASAFTHTILPTDGQPSQFSAYEEISDGLDRFKHTDAMVNTFHMEAEANGYLMATAGVLGRSMEATTTDIDAIPLLDNSPLIVGTNVLVQYDGLTLPAKSFNFDVNNQIEEDDFYLGSFFRGSMTAKRREVTAQVSLRHEDKSAFRQAMFGTPNATQIGGLTTKKELKITALTYEKIGASTLSYGVSITIPKGIYNPFSYAPSGDDALENDIDITAVRPDAAVPILTAVVTNDVAAIN